MVVAKLQEKKPPNSTLKPKLEKKIEKDYRLGHLALAVISSAVILLVLLGGELLLRFIHRDQDTKSVHFSTFSSMEEQESILDKYEQIGYSYKPFLLWQANPNQDNEVISTNSLGYRGKNWHKKTDGVFRIIVLGGSSVWGYGASGDDKTLAAYLEKELNKRLLEDNSRIHSFTSVEVLKLGQPGYVSAQEFLMWKEIPAHSPDLVIHYGGFNDLYAGFTRQAGWNLSGINEDLLVKNKLAAAVSLVKIELQNYLNKSKLFNYLRFHLNSLSPKPNFAEKQADHRAAVDEYCQNLGFIEAVADDLDIPVLFIFQSSLFWGEKQLSPEEKTSYQQFIENYPEAQNFFSSSYGYLTQQSKCSDKQIVDGINFYDPFSENIYIDHVHTSDKGYEIAAQELAGIVWGKMTPRIKRR